MSTVAKGRQSSVQVPRRETDTRLKERAGSPQKQREREEVLLQMFSEAGEDVTDEDLQERESLVAGFSGNT